MAPRHEREHDRREDRRRVPFDPDAEIERRVGDYQVGGMDSFGLYADEARGESRSHREAEMRQFERSFREEPRGGRQFREREHDHRSGLYGRGGYGWPGADSPDPRERRGEPHERARDAQHRLDSLIDHFRDEVERVDDAQLEAILETAAEVLGSLKKTLRDYERRNEPACR